MAPNKIPPKVKTLYDALKVDGADVGTEKEFSDWFFKPGYAGYRNRLSVYEAFKADGADVGESYEEFADWLQLAPVKSPAAPTAPPTNRLTPTDTDNLKGNYGMKPLGIDTTLNGRVADAQRKHIEPEQTPGDKVAQEAADGGSQEPWQPTPLQKALMMQETQDVVDDFDAKSGAIVDNAKRVAEVTTGYSAELATDGNGRTVIKKKKSDRREKMKAGRMFARMNGVETDPIGIRENKVLPPLRAPEGGPQGDTWTEGAVFYGMTRDENDNLVPTWMMPDGSLTSSFSEADASVTEARKERKRRFDISVEGQLQHEQERLERLREQKREAMPADDVAKMEEDSGFKIYNQAPGYGLGTDNEQVRSLNAAIRQSEERIKKLEQQRDVKNCKDVGFWRGVWDTVTDSRTWDFGAQDITDTMTMLNTSRKTEKRKALSAEEQEMMKATFDNQNTAGADNFWNRAGVMTAEMIPFMIDFTLMGGANAAPAAITEGLTRYMFKGLYKTAPKVAHNKIAKWTIKTLGAMPEELVRSAVMTNTVQGAKTTSDIIERKLGGIEQDKDGNFRFENEKSWSSAIWQGEANNIIENYSEMFGTHLEGVLSLKTAAKLADVFGAKRLSAVLTKASAGQVAGIAGKVQGHLTKLGVSDYVGEVGEEYYGQLLRTALNLDDAYKPVYDADGNPVYKKDKEGNILKDKNGKPIQERENLLMDGQFHGDILGGMALSMGLMGAGKYSIAAAGYGMMKHRVNKADSRASRVFTPEIWEGIRQTIDGIENENIGDYIDRLRMDPKMTDQQREAAMDYVLSSLALRGYNLANLAEQRDREDTETAEDEAGLNESYLDGYNAATPEEMANAAAVRDTRRERLVGALSEDEVVALEAMDPVSALASLRDKDPELRQIAADYINARVAYNGMIERVRDDIDSRIAENDAEIDSRTNRGSGTIVPARIFDNDNEEGRPVFVIDGNVAMLPDGTGVDKGNSDKSIIIRDEETGEIRFADLSEVLGIGVELDPNAEKQIAGEQIRQEMAEEAAASIEPDDEFPEIDPVRLNIDIDHQEDRSRDQNEENGLDNPNRNKALMPDDWKMPYDKRPVRAARYIESENGIGGTQYEDENGNAALVLVALDDNTYVGYFREYDESGNPTNQWSAKFQNGHGDKAVYSEMMRTAQTLLPEVHELTEHTSVSTDGLRNLANQLRHGYELQYDEHGDIVTTEVAVNMMAKENALGITDYDAGSINVARVTSDEYMAVAQRLIPYMEALGLTKHNIHWENGVLYVDHPILRKKADAEAYDRGYEQGIEVSASLSDDVLNEAITDLRGREHLSDEWRGRLEAYEYEQQRRAMEAQNAPADQSTDEEVQPHIIATYADRKGSKSEIYVETDTTDKDGVRKITFGRNLTKYDGTQKQGMPGQLVIADSMIDWERTLNGVDASGNPRSTELDPEEYERTREAWSNVMTGAAQDFRAKELRYSSDGKVIVAENTEGVKIFLNSDPLKQQESAPEPQAETALSRIPTNEQGEPDFDAVDADTAWDAILEDSDGDPDIARNVINQEIAEKEEALRKLSRQKPKTGLTTRQKIQAEKEKKQLMDNITASIEHWRNMGATEERRAADRTSDKPAAETASRDTSDRPADTRGGTAVAAEGTSDKAADARDSEAEKPTGREVPDWADDRPEDARRRGFRMVDGERVERNPEQEMPEGKNRRTVKFNDRNIVDCVDVAMDASQLAPSHYEGRENPRHMIPEAQPKKRTDAASVAQANHMAAKMNPEEITGGVTAFSGAPVVNRRGEAVQGNGRLAGLMKMWESHPERAAVYKEYLKQLAREGKIANTEEEIEAMKAPVAVRMIDVSDEEAIRLGNIPVDDTEAGGRKRMEPVQTASKIASENGMAQFGRMLMHSDEDSDLSLKETIRQNGFDVLKWMHESGWINDTQYQTALDLRDSQNPRITQDAVDDLQGILYETIFQGASGQFRDKWEDLPVKAQRALLSTAFRDLESPEDAKVLPELQNAVSAYQELSQMDDFNDARNEEAVRRAVKSWQGMSYIGPGGEVLVHGEKYTNFAVELAILMRTQKQRDMQKYLNDLFDLVQGKHELTLEEMADGKTKEDFANVSLADAIMQVFGIEYEPQNSKRYGENGSDALAGDGTTGTRGQRDMPPSSGSREQDPARRGTEDSRRGADGDRQEGEIVTDAAEDTSDKPAAAEGNGRGNADFELTEADLDALPADFDEDTREQARDYILGDRNPMAEIGYKITKEYVRDQRNNSGGSSRYADAPHVAGEGADQTRGGVRPSGSEAGGVDRTDGAGALAGSGKSREDGPRGSGSSTGEGGSERVAGEESGSGADNVGSGKRGRSSRSGGRGSNVRGSNRKEGGKAHSGTDGRGISSASEGINQGEQQADDIISDALSTIRDILKNPGMARPGQLNDVTTIIAGLGVNAARLIGATAKLGYGLVRKGYYRFARWNSEMHRNLDPVFNEYTDLNDDQMAEFIRSAWDMKVTYEGQRKRVSEWAAELEGEELRRLAQMTIDEKRRAQKEAEGTEVITGNLDNIRETLPFLLPAQHEDVEKAERQFFDPTHADRVHGYGKGYLFTNGTGTGKTYTGLGIVKRFIKQGKGRVLILTPSQTKVSDWIKDASNLNIDLHSLDDWAKQRGTTATNEAGDGAVITTFANFRQNEALLSAEFDLIVYDESHRLLENKQGAYTSGMLQHQKVSNKNEQFAFIRLRDIDPVYKELMRCTAEYTEQYGRHVGEAFIRYGRYSAAELRRNGLIAPDAGSSWTEADRNRFPEFWQASRNIQELQERFNNEVKPVLEQKAKEAAGRTKVVFLSATPFNTRENLDYAEGYIFSYPENQDNGQSGRSRFYLENFGAGYKWRYHRLERSMENPQALARQEVAFSDYLQNTLGTMSGRIIDSQYDYSRDFPTVTGDYASRFNEAMAAFSMSEAMRMAYWSVMGDYIYTSALFESMKVSQTLPRIRQHLAMGRKVVVYHRRVESNKPIVPPFSYIFDTARQLALSEKDSDKQDRYLREIDKMREDFSDMLEWEKALDLRMPREQLADAFGKDKVLFFSGKETTKQKNKAVAEFNSDESGKNLIVIQEASGKEGISLHDTTGNHQRVLITLALPQSPITALQIEGRIYRIGNRSNAIFEYPLLGLDSEMILFGQKFNSQVGTTENLALGSKGRNLRDSFARGVEERSGDVAFDNQGLGGKDLDSGQNLDADPFGNAVLDYYSNQRISGRRDNREGKDYYPTPEPLGFKMGEWARISEGESVLEPSAGHGAIARYVPESNQLTAIEPSSALFGRLQIKCGGMGRKFENTIFENYNVVNKHDVVLMNPPFGTAGSLAVAHVAKAFGHLEEGGRIVAIIPRGSADRKFEKWYNEENSAVLTGEVILPDITFQRAGTNVNCRVVIIDKISNPDLAMQAGSKMRKIDLSGNRYGTIEEFFDDLRDIDMPDRTIDTNARMRKLALAPARELRTIKGMKEVTVSDGFIRINGRGVWETIEWDGKYGIVLDRYLQDRFKSFTNSANRGAQWNRTETEAAYIELRALVARLSGKTIDEMERITGAQLADARNWDSVNERSSEYGDQPINSGAQATVKEPARPRARVRVSQPSLFDEFEENAAAVQPSLFDQREDTSDRPADARQERQSRGGDSSSATIEDAATEGPENPAAEAADVAIDDYCVRFAEIADRYERLTEQAEDEALKEELQDRLAGELYEEGRILTESLERYYLSEGQSGEDARHSARDMSVRVRADLTLQLARKKGIELDFSAPATNRLTHETADGAATHRTAGGETIELRADGGLRKLEDGEYTLVERKFSEAGYFGFTGTERIESADDVAFIFRSLENYSVENTFAVLEKDGKPLIVHLGMGTATASMADATAIRGAFEAYGADRIWFVHNHPSGVLRSSPQDQSLLRKIQGMFEQGVVQDGIIIDTTSGKYATFDESGDSEIHERPQEGSDSATRTVRLDRTDYSEGHRSDGLTKAKSPDSIADFVSSRRLGRAGKIGYLLLDNSLNIIGNLYSTHTDIGDRKTAHELAREIARMAVGHGALRVALYGNMEMNNIGNVRERLRTITGESVDIIDAIQITNGLNQSAFDMGYLREAGAEYGHVEDPGAGEEQTTKPTLIDVVKTLYEKGKNAAAKIYNRSFFDVAKTPDFMKKYGLTGDKFTIRYGVIARHFGKDAEHNLPLEIWEKLPEALGNPFAITRYFQDENKKKQKGYRIYTTLRLTNGAYVVVAAEVKNANRQIDVNAINTVFGRSAISETHEELIYRSEMTTPVQQSLLDGNNPHQYPAERELSDDKSNTLPSEKQTSEAKSSDTDGMEDSDTLLRIREEEPLAWGESGEILREARELAEHEARRKRERVEELCERLNLDNVEIVEDGSGFSGKRVRAKGFYNRRTGKITIILSNNRSVADVEQTLLHEAVAHHGLRELFGEAFDEFLDTVFNAATREVQERISLLASRNGWNRRTATEEYLAGLAEDMEYNEKSGWFARVKQAFIDMLERFGFRHLRAGTLSDNELRYILWRSYQNLVEGGSRRVYSEEARDVAMQTRLGTGGFEVDEKARLREINERFNEQLDSWESGSLRPDEVVNAGYPTGVMRQFMPQIPILLRQKVLSKSRKKHGLSAREMHNLPEALAKPIFVFKSTEGTVSLLTRLRSDKGENLFVAVELGKDLNLGGRAMEVNDILTIHGRETENVVLPIVQNGTLAWVDKEKGLEWLHSAKSNSQAITTQILDSAAKIVENFENPTISEQNYNNESDDDVLLRDGDFTERDRVMASGYYERMLKRGSWQFREAMQDSMLGLKTLYEAIGGSRKLRIENIPGYQNAYLYENRMSSTNNAEQSEYFTRYMKPLLDEINELVRYFPDGKKANRQQRELRRQELTDYMMAKHGLERNAYMRAEAASNGEETERDFAGLTALTGEADWKAAEAAAQKMVDDYEAENKVDSLWDKVNAATRATLDKIFTSGMISEETYNKVLGMYQYYIPLRGWDETTSDEVYGYLTSNDGPLLGNVFKKAKGRLSKADDPIAYIAKMADDAIRQGNRNIMKQRFLNYVLDNPSDLVSVNRLWLHLDDTTGEWSPIFPELTPDMTPEEVEEEVKKFEEKVKLLAESDPDHYKQGRDAKNVPYKVVNQNMREHQVLVKRDGLTYVLTINGNPRAAQALNGLTNPDTDTSGVVGNMLKLGEYVNRHLSAFYTTRYPDFVVSNFLRDMLYSNCMTWVKESPSYALRFNRNFGRVNPVIIMKLVAKWENGTLNKGDYIERMFLEFMRNGGETGYTSVRDIEGHKRAIAAELKKQGSVGRQAWSALGSTLDLFNRGAENCARFAAFLTSREMGRTLDRSIYDAKEVSVNFNKKGSGGKFVNATGQKTLGKIGSYLSGGGRIAYVFWSAGVQGLTNFARQAKRNPKKFLTGAAALFTLGALIPLLAQLMGVGDGDDDDKNAYYNLPEYIRRSNICFRVGDQWITIPLPIEYRPIYGLGELATGVISGNERYSGIELALHIVGQISQIMPLDMLEGGGGVSPFIPSAFKPFTEAYIMNKGWTGLPVYRDNAFNKMDPEWTKAYSNADQHLVDFARWLNETTGGDDYKKGAIDINPAKIEYLLNGTFGGVVSFPMKILKSGETMFGKRDFEWRNVPLANRVVKTGDERTEYRKLQNEYFKYYEEYKETNRLRKKYENAAADSILGYAERENFLHNSDEYLRFEVFERFKPEIDAIRSIIKEESDPNKSKELQKDLYQTQRDLVNALHDPKKYLESLEEASKAS